MKIIKSIFITSAAIATLGFFSACSDYDYSKELASANIEGPITVKSSTGNVYNAVIEDDVIKIKINPDYDLKEELGKAVPTFYMSMGATCSPDPSAAQNFSVDGGVKYTITSGDHKHTKVYTFTWTESDQLPYGDGYSKSVILAEKSFPQLGYPGSYESFNQGESNSLLYGDLLMFPAVSGEYVVCFSRAYAWNNNSEYAFKVFNVADLSDSGKTFNTGGIDLTSILSITSDWKGHIVAAVGVDGSNTKIYYWKSALDAPVLAGNLPVNISPNVNKDDLTTSIQVAGDITGDAVITSVLSPRDAVNDDSFVGAHYKVNVTGGSIASTFKIVYTGYDSNDDNKFQMISYFGVDDDAMYLVGDTEGGAVNGSCKVYLNSASGSTLSVMPAYLNGRKLISGTDTWWSSTGMEGLRGYARRPFVQALVLNGKPYSWVLTGYSWVYATMMMSQDMTSFIDDALTYDTSSFVQNITNSTQVTTNNGWAYGSAGDWYFDDDSKVGYLVLWNGRLGLTTFTVSCYE